MIMNTGNSLKNRGGGGGGLGEANTQATTQMANLIQNLENSAKMVKV